MIETFLDEAKLPFRTLEQKVFDAAVDYVFRNFPKWGREVNATLGALNSLAAGGAYAFPYVFDGSDANSDPGVGRLRLGSNTQNAATVMRMDVQIVGGVDISNVLADLQASTSSVKGSIRLVKMTDPSKWIIFDVTAVAILSGYRNLTVRARASSGANPFASGDPLMVYIDRNGDSGTVPGATELLAEQSISGVSALSFPNVFTSAFDWYLVDIERLAFSSNTSLFLRLISGGSQVTTGYYEVPANSGTGTMVNTFNLTPGGSAKEFSGLVQLRNMRGSGPRGYSCDGMYYADISGWPPGSVSNQGVTQRGMNMSASVADGFTVFIGGSASIAASLIRVYGVRKV